MIFFGSSASPFYTNRFCALPAAIAFRPIDCDQRGAKLHPKPTVTGLLSAIVVGNPDAPLTSERDHRVKIQFHWQRGARSHSRLTHPFTANAPADSTAGTWVRVLSAWAGANWGHVFLPRIGQEVLVECLEGDIDRPVIVGAAYNGRGREDAAHNQIQANVGSATANAPAWFAGNGHNAVLSGIKTQTLNRSQDGTGGYNQIVFDDTPDEARLSLQTTQESSELNLGHLKQQKDNQRLNDRGHGFELKTEAHGAVRAGQGLLISSDARLNARSDQLDSQEAQQTLETSHARATALAEAATSHRAETTAKLPAIDALAHQHEVIGQRTTQGAQDTGGAGEVSAYSEPDIIVSSPAGLTTLSGSDSILNANRNLSFIAEDINLAAQDDFSAAVKSGIALFTSGLAAPNSKPQQQTGIKLHAADGTVEIEAQSSTLQAAAEHDVRIASNANIDIAAPNHALLNSGGAYIKLEGGNIEIHAPGKVTFKAGMKVWTGPQQTDRQFEELPKSESFEHAKQLMVQSLEGNALEGAFVKLYHRSDKTSLLQTSLDGTGTTQIDERTKPLAYTAIAGYESWTSAFTDMDTLEDEPIEEPEYQEESCEDGREEERMCREMK